jgi:hypothetical protein
MSQVGGAPSMCRPGQCAGSSARTARGITRTLPAVTVHECFARSQLVVVRRDPSRSCLQAGVGGSRARQRAPHKQVVPLTAEHVDFLRATIRVDQQLICLQNNAPYIAPPRTAASHRANTARPARRRRARRAHVQQSSMGFGEILVSVSFGQNADANAPAIHEHSHPSVIIGELLGGARSGRGRT